jgi:hypothetical protein
MTLPTVLRNLPELLISRNITLKFKGIIKMSEISKLLKDAQNPQQRLMAQTRGLVTKWEKTGLLEGIDNDSEKSGMAVLLENQAKQLIDESRSGTGQSSGNEEWSGVALPLVRRVFAEIAAKEFVSVQPMNLPSGLIFYLDFKYGSNQSQQQKTKSLFGGDGGKYGSTNDAEGGLYGTGRHGYTINDQEVLDVDLASTTVSLGNNAQKVAMTWTPSNTLNVDFEGARAFTFSESEGTVIESIDDITSTNLGGGNGSVTVNATLKGGKTKTDCSKIDIKYHVQPTDSSRGDFEVGITQDFHGDADSTGKDVGIPEVNLELKSEPIVAKTRKLKAVWTPELAQDLNAYHSIDAEAELTSLLSEYVSMEIDLEILDMLLVNAHSNSEWDATVSATGGYVQGTWFQTLGTQIQGVSNKIHQLTLRGGANFLVCSPAVATILESIPGYAADTDGNQSQFAMGVSKVGALNNRFQVYKNPYMTTDTILVGFRGSNFLETGAVYAPYIPLIQTPLVYDPVNFTPRRGVMTRYAKKMVRPEFYGSVKVLNADQFNPS